MVSFRSCFLVTFCKYVSLLDCFVKTNEDFEKKRNTDRITYEDEG